MTRWRASGRHSSSQSTTARLSGLLPERANETTRKRPDGGRQLSGCVRMRPAGTADTGTPSAALQAGGDALGRVDRAARAREDDGRTRPSSELRPPPAVRAHAPRRSRATSAGCCAISRSVCAVAEAQLLLERSGEQRAERAAAGERREPLVDGRRDRSPRDRRGVRAGPRSIAFMSFSACPGGGWGLVRGSLRLDSFIQHRLQNESIGKLSQ